MEKMPFRPDLDRIRGSQATTTATVSSDWTTALPVLIGKTVMLRELQIADAPSLFAMLTAEEVSRFISPPPTTIEGFEKFIEWTHGERAAGRYVCFAVVPHGMESAIGLFQVRQLEPGFASAEWGFALGSPFWGKGMFVDAGQMVVDCAVDTLSVGRLGARACVANGRGNGALRKLGAVQEGILRRSFMKNGQFLDQMLWSILAEEWKQGKAIRSPERVH